MSLSPVDVREVEFVLVRRGYDERQVDDFLDLVVEALEERDAALAAATSGTSASDGPQASSSVVDLFAMAQRTAEEHVAAAERAAEEVLAQARQEASRLRAAAHLEQAADLEALSRERDRVERQLGELQQLLRTTRAELESYLTRVFDTVRGADGEASGPHAVPLSA